MHPPTPDAGPDASSQRRRRRRRSDMLLDPDAGSDTQSIPPSPAPSQPFSNVYSSGRRLTAGRQSSRQSSFVDQPQGTDASGQSPPQSQIAPTARSRSHAYSVRSSDDSDASSQKQEEGEYEDRNRPVGVIGLEKRLQAKDHFLITVGPPDWIEGTIQPHHGGRPDADRFGLDPSSACTVGAFVKPWLRVPAGGCLAAKFRNPTDRNLWWALLGVWALIAFCAIFGFLEGDLERLRAGGNDALGNICGSAPRNPPPGVVLDDLELEWESLRYLWFPVDPHEVGGSIDAVKRNGICVSKCPHYVPNMRWTKWERDEFAIKQYYWDEEVSPGNKCLRNVTCRTVNYCSRSNEVGCIRQFRVLYPTVPMHRLCVPDIWGSNENVDPAVLDLAQRFAGTTVPYVADWWFSVTADAWAAGYVLFMSFILNFVFGEVYLMATRKSPIATAWGSVLLLVATSIATAVQFFDHYSYIDGLAMEHKFSLRKRHQSQFRILAWIVLVIGILNALMCFRVRAKVKVACRMMIEANKVLAESPGMSLVAPAVWLLHLLLAAAASTLMVWVGTIGTLTEVDGRITTVNRNADVYHLTPVVLQLSEARPYLQVVLVSGALWTMGFVNMLGYNLTTYLSVMWYFSSPGEPKDPPKKGVWLTLSCIIAHIGSYSFAAVLMTLFESVRGLLDSIQERLREILQKINELNKIFKYFTCLIQYTLMLFDKFLKLVRRDAFVVQAIEGSDFTHAARRAGRLFDKFRSQVQHIADVCETVSLFGRLGILSLVALVTAIPLLHSSWGDDIDNPIVVMIFACGWAFFVATLYAQITTAAMDTFIMCYCYDMDVNDGSKRRPFYTHVSLKRFIDKHAEIENEYRNIHEGKDVMTLSGWRQMVHEGRQTLRETISQTRKQTRDAAKAAQQKTKQLAEEAEAAARKTQEAAKGAAKAAVAAKQAAADAAAKVGATVEKVGEKVPAGGLSNRAGGLWKKVGEGVASIDAQGKKPARRGPVRHTGLGAGPGGMRPDVPLGAQSGVSHSGMSQGRSVAGSRRSRD